MPEPTIFVVESIHWEYNDEGGNDRGGQEPLLAFRDRTRAEAYRVAKEREARVAWHNPNPVGHTHSCDRDAEYLAEVTSLDEPTLIARLEERGLPLPPLSEYDAGPQYAWGDEGWWRQAEAALSKEERPWLWGLFDRVAFFEVVEVPLGNAEES